MMKHRSLVFRVIAMVFSVAAMLCACVGLQAPYAHADENPGDSSSSEALGPDVVVGEGMEKLYASSVSVGSGENTVNITYVNQSDKRALIGTTVSLYHVADWDGSKGTYAPTEDFADAEKFPVSWDMVNASLNEWRDFATTVLSYIAANGTETDMKASIGDDAKAQFTGLSNGLYLVATGAFTTKTLNCDASGLFVSFPNLHPSDNDDERTVSISPKASCTVPEKYRDPVTVRKVWNDGNSADRPKSVTVQLLDHGKVYDTQELNAQNNWSHTWHNLEDHQEWRVVEVGVPSGYTVSIDNDQVNTETEVVTITNTKPVTPPAQTPPPAQTGAEIYTVIAVAMAALAIGVLLIVKARKTEV